MSFFILPYLGPLCKGFLHFFSKKARLFFAKSLLCVDKRLFLYYNIVCIIIGRVRPLKERHMKFINIGFGNMVAVDRMVALVSPDSAPIKRLIQDAKDEGRTIDVTCGRRTRAVIITDSEHVILSAIQAETIAGRLENDVDDGDDVPEDEE